MRSGLDCAWKLHANDELHSCIVAGAWAGMFASTAGSQQEFVPPHPDLGEFAHPNYYRRSTPSRMLLLASAADRSCCWVGGLGDWFVHAPELETPLGRCDTLSHICVNRWIEASCCNIYQGLSLHGLDNLGE